MSALATVAGGLVSSAGQIYANQQNIKANDARFGSEVELANTAHQREIADLAAAGLNPILSASGSGAAVPQLGAADVGSISDKLGDSIQSAARLRAIDIPLKESQVAVNSATAENLVADGVLKKAQAAVVQKGLDAANSAIDAARGPTESLTEKLGNHFGPKLVKPSEEAPTGLSPRMLDWYLKQTPERQEEYKNYLKKKGRL